MSYKVYECKKCGAKLLEDADNLLEGKDGVKKCGVCAPIVEDDVKEYEEFVDAEANSTER